MNAWLFRLISLVVTVMSPEIKAQLKTWLDQMREDAKKTKNPWDDLLVGLLRSLLLGE